MKTSKTKDTFSDIDEKNIKLPFVLGSTERQELERYNPLRAATVIKYLWHYNSNAYIINYSNIGIVSSLDTLKQALNQLQEDANIQKSNVLIFLVDQLTHSFSEKVINQHYTALIFRCGETNNIQWNYIDPLGHGIRKSMAEAIRSSYEEETIITSYKGKIQYVIEQENIYLGNTYDNGTFLIFLVTQLLNNQDLYNIEEWCNNNEYFDIKEPETKVKLSRYLGKAIRKTLLLEDGKSSPDIESLLSVTDIPNIFNAKDPKHLYDLLKVGAKVDAKDWRGNSIYECNIAEKAKSLIRNYTLRQESTTKLLHKAKSNGDTDGIVRPVVWGLPNVIRTEKGFEDDFIYQGSTPEKTVYIPFTAIHKKLTESNWIMRGGKLKPTYQYDSKPKDPNYVTAHIGFIVSDKPHYLEQGSYNGGRTFIDFPIIWDLKILSQVQIFTNEDFQNFARETSNYLGNYPIYTTWQHSEVGLIDFLKGNVENIVSVLKCKLSYKYGSHVGHKIYAVTLFINSQRNVCHNTKPEYGECEKKLYELMTSTNSEDFLYKLKLKLNENHIKTLTSSNDKIPYMCITISCYMYSNKGKCYTTVWQDAKSALQYNTTEQDYRNLSIDIKQLSSKVILSIYELWLDDKTAKDRSGQIKKSFQDEHNGLKIPFYSGCKSGKNAPEDLISKFIEEEKLENPEYGLPMCLDGIDIFTMVNQYDDDTILELTMSCFQTMTLGDSDSSDSE